MNFKNKDDLANRREAVGKESENSVISLLGGKRKKEIKNWQVEIKKLSKNQNECGMKEFIIDRSKPPQEIETQIERLAEKFQELEQDQGSSPEEKSFKSLGMWTIHHLEVMIRWKWKFRQL